MAEGVFYSYYVRAIRGNELSGFSNYAELRGKAVTAANTPATGAPSISGTAQVGETLTADTSGIADEDGLENVAFSYQCWPTMRTSPGQRATPTPWPTRT